jgi:predicted GNAT superfamily acetyltransferase
MAIRIEPVTSVAGAEHFQILERMIWGSPPEDAVPVHVTITAVHNGGGLLGAFADDGPPETGSMIGLAFWWPGIGNNKRHAQPASQQIKMCSHMAGVLPAWQGTGIGLQLKLAQRTAILAQGMTDWVTWTYDPLQRTNAVFNIRRLGAVCNTYKENWYGVMRDGLNAGTPSDRCEVDWWLASDRVADRINRRQVEPAPSLAYTQVLPVEWTDAGLAAPPQADLRIDGAPLAIPIPEDIGAVRRADAQLGMAWRLFLRRALQVAFSAGYAIVDCVQTADGTWCYYLVHSA